MKLRRYIRILMMVMLMAGVGDGLHTKGCSKWPVSTADARMISPDRPLSDEFSLNEGERWLSSGDTLLMNGNLREALKAYEQALSEFRRTGNSQKQGETLVKIGLTYQSLREYTEALDSFELAIRIFRTFPNVMDEGRTLSCMGRVHIAQSRYDQALKYFRQASDIAKQENDSDGEGLALNGMGEAYRYLGDFTKALASYRRIMDIVKEDDLVGKGRNWVNIGNVHVGLGQYRKALQAYQQALTTLEHIEQHHDYVGIGTIYASRGEIYRRLGDDRNALDNFQKARRMFREVSEQSAAQRKEAMVLNGLGIVYEQKCQSSLTFCLTALHAYSQAQKIQETIQDRHGKATTLHNLGGLYDRWAQKTGNPKSYTQALDSYKESLAITKKLGNLAIQARTLNNIGEILIALSAYEKRAKHLEEALEVLNKARITQQQIGDRGREWLTISNTGRVYELQGQPAKALNTYQDALTMLETLVEEIGIDALKIDLSAQAATIYQHAILLLTQEQKNIQAFELSEHARARAFLDQIGNLRPNMRSMSDQALLAQEQELRAQLSRVNTLLRVQSEQAQGRQNAGMIESLHEQRQTLRKQYEQLRIDIQTGNPEYGSLIQVAPLTLQKVQSLLKEAYPDTTVLSYFVTAHKTLAFVIAPHTVTGEEIIMEELVVSETELEELIRTSGRSEDLPLDSLKRLHALLIAPLKKHLTTSTIGIIPYGVLHYLPFAALTDGKTYLGDEYTLFTLPSVSVLKFLQEKRTPDAVGVLAVAHKGYPPLEYVEPEVNSIRKIANARLLLGSKATESLFRSLADRFSIVHLAAHGEFNPVNPLFSRIILAPESEGANDGHLEVHEVYDLHLQQTNLVVLSACQTHLGKRSRGDDIIGLTRAFMYAGTPSVISTLWNVNDQAVSDFMVAFYTHLNSGKSPARALQAAQRTMRKTSSYAHPYYWAGLVLTGDPGLTTKQTPWLAILVLTLITGGIIGGILRKWVVVKTMSNTTTD